MHLIIGAVGNIREPHYRLAQQEYSKRLNKYARLNIVEVADDPVPAGEKDRLAVKEREGERLLKRLPAGSMRVALVLGGHNWTSEQLSSWLGRETDAGRGVISFLIGGTLGLPSSLIDSADLRLSLSAMTFPHQLARVILLEQLYRAYRILHHAPYHY